ncbi:hypothetical protein KC326_g174 [Hortaea werneckii]|nr:hypothetical protein KC326_g174 [Hortaea werneckii]
MCVKVNWRNEAELQFARIGKVAWRPVSKLLDSQLRHYSIEVWLSRSRHHASVLQDVRSDIISEPAASDGEVESQIRHCQAWKLTEPWGGLSESKADKALNGDSLSIADADGIHAHGDTQRDKRDKAVDAGGKLLWSPTREASL